MTNKDDLTLRIPEESLSRFYIEIGKETFEIPVYRLNAPRAFELAEVEKKMLSLKQDLNEGACEDPSEALVRMYEYMNHMLCVMIPGFDKYAHIFTRIDFSEDIIVALFEKIAKASLDRSDSTSTEKKNTTSEQKTPGLNLSSGAPGSRRQKSRKKRG